LALEGVYNPTPFLLIAQIPQEPHHSGKGGHNLKRGKGGRPWGTTHTHEHHCRTNTMHRIAGKVPDSLQPAPTPTTTSLPDSEFMITIVLVALVWTFVRGECRWASPATSKITLLLAPINQSIHCSAVQLLPRHDRRSRVNHGGSLDGVSRG